MRNTRYENGFTLVELLVALMVTSIILGAVSALAYAMGTANDASDDTSYKQARVRYATLRISELIKHCKLVCGTGGTDVAIWQADDDDNGQININELVYIDAGPGRDHLRLYRCKSESNPVIALGDIQSVGTVWWLGFYDSETYIKLVPDCSNVQFTFDTAPPQSKFVSISFDLVENENVHRYQISAALRSWAGHLLGDSGNIVTDDD